MQKERKIEEPSPKNPTGGIDKPGKVKEPPSRQDNKSIEDGPMPGEEAAP